VTVVLEVLEVVAEVVVGLAKTILEQ